MGEVHIDKEALGVLKEVMEDEFQTLLDTFTNDSLTRIESLKTAVSNQDADMLRRTAHSLKGSSSNIGAPMLADLCAKLEEQGVQQQFEGAEQLLSAIEAEYEVVAEDLGKL